MARLRRKRPTQLRRDADHKNRKKMALQQAGVASFFCRRKSYPEMGESLMKDYQAKSGSNFDENGWVESLGRLLVYAPLNGVLHQLAGTS